MYFSWYKVNFGGCINVRCIVLLIYKMKVYNLGIFKSVFMWNEIIINNGCVLGI